MELYRLTWINSYVSSYSKNKLYSTNKIELKEKLPELIYNTHTKKQEAPKFWIIDKLIPKNKEGTIFCDVATNRIYSPELEELYKPESLRCNEEEKKLLNKLLNY